MPCLLRGVLLNSYSIVDAKCSPGCLASSCGGFLFNFYSKLTQNAHLAASPPPVVVSYFTSYSNLMQKCSSGCLASSRGGFLFNSYSNYMQNALLSASPPRGAPVAPFRFNYIRTVSIKFAQCGYAPTTQAMHSFKDMCTLHDIHKK